MIDRSRILSKIRSLGYKSSRPEIVKRRKSESWCPGKSWRWERQPPRGSVALLFHLLRPPSDIDIALAQ